MRRTHQRRSYESPLREEQARATRRRILDGAVELLRKHAPTTVPDLAAHVGVSVPTIHRHFPTRDDLLKAAVDHIQALVPAPDFVEDPDRVERWVEPFVLYRFEVARRLGRLGSAQETQEARRAVTVPRRREVMARMVASWAPALDEAEQALIRDVLVVVVSDTMTHALAEYLDLSPKAAAQHLTWLVEAVREQAVAQAASRRGQPRSRR